MKYSTQCDQNHISVINKFGHTQGLSRARAFVQQDTTNAMISLKLRNYGNDPVGINFIYSKLFLFCFWSRSNPGNGTARTVTFIPLTEKP